LSSPTVPVGGTLTVSAGVANTGPVEAEEIVQLYTRQLVGSVTRPVRELKGFRRVRLKPGQKQTVEFALRTADLAFYNQRGQLVTEPGPFQVWVAPDSSQGLRGEFRVTE
ncbi:MAG: fibronectin type III-like domain-contianing protein, partial [Bryobacteraceae bacterium]